MRRVLTLCLFIIIMVLYISIQLYWGVNLYKAFMNEEKKELDDLLSSVITSYAATTLSKNASNPDSPTLTLERVSTENDSVITNAVVTGIVKEPEELSSTLEKVLIVASYELILFLLIGWLNHLSRSYRAEIFIHWIWSYVSTTDSQHNPPLKYRSRPFHFIPYRLR